jgi:hypothetical protein
MKLFADLFTTDYGLVALAFTLVSLALAVGMRLFILKKIRDSDQPHPMPQTPHSKE